MTEFNLIPIKEFEQPSKPSWKFKPADASKFEASKSGEFRYTVQSGNTPGDIFNKARKLAQQNGEELTARSPQELLKENNIGKSFRAGQTIVIATRTKDSSPAQRRLTQNTTASSGYRDSRVYGYDSYVPYNPSKLEPQAAPQAAPPKPAVATGRLSAEQKNEFERIFSDPKASMPERSAAMVALQKDRVKKDPQTLEFKELLTYLKMRCNPAFAKKLEEMGVKSINLSSSAGRKELAAIWNKYVRSHFVDATTARKYLDAHPELSLNSPDDIENLPKAGDRYQANCSVYSKVFKMLFEAAGMSTKYYGSSVSVGDETEGHQNTVGFAGNYMFINNNGRALSTGFRYNQNEAKLIIKEMIEKDIKGANVIAIYPDKSIKDISSLLKKDAESTLLKARLIRDYNKLEDLRQILTGFNQTSADEILKLFDRSDDKRVSKYRHTEIWLDRKNEDIEKIYTLVKEMEGYLDRLNENDSIVADKETAIKGQPRTKKELKNYLNNLTKQIDDAITKINSDKAYVASLKAKDTNKPA